VEVEPVAEAVELGRDVEAVRAAFAVGAGQRARVSGESDAVAAIEPNRYHPLVSASSIRIHCPRSSRSRLRSLRSARSSCGIVVRRLSLPRLSPTTADRLAPKRRI
jgi:hypothetical protein